MTLQFNIPHQCIADLERRVSREPMRFQGRKGAGRQVQCAKCKRWKYADERCNLFETVSNVGNGDGNG